MNMLSSTDSLNQRDNCRSAVSRLIKISAVAFVISVGSNNVGAVVTIPDPPIIVPAKDSCRTFDLGILGEGDRKETKVFTDKDGNPVRFFSGGKGYSLTFFNMTSGALLRIRPSGSVSRSVVNQDGSTTVTNTGHNVLIQFEQDIPGPNAKQYIGRMIYTIGVDGIFRIEGTSGKVFDICAALGG